MHCRCVFFGRALETVVDFELGNDRVDDDLNGLPAGVKDEDAFRIRPEDLQLTAVRRRAVTRDNDPGSDKLLFERFCWAPEVAGSKATPNPVTSARLAMLRRSTVFLPVGLERPTACHRQKR